MIPGSVTQAQAGPVVLGGIPVPCAELGFADCKEVWLNFLTPLLFLCHSRLCFWQKILLILVTVPCRVSMSYLYPASPRKGLRCSRGSSKPRGPLWEESGLQQQVM